jgi:quercetin dioxygenase-like cupin family protein
MMTDDERMKRESSLIATIRTKLPEFAKVCADDAELVLLHQDAFAADYQEDEYKLLGMAIKYAGLRGKEVRVIGKNRSTLGVDGAIQGTRLPGSIEPPASGGSATIAHRSTPVPFIDTSALEVIERLPGWYGRYFHSPSMTFAHYDFKRGSSIHEHFHPQEEVYEVIEGELELTIDGVKQVARPGMVGIVPSNVPHSVKALTDGRAIIVDYPSREDMGEKRL